MNYDAEIMHVLKLVEDGETVIGACRIVAEGTPLKPQSLLNYVYAEKGAIQNINNWLTDEVKNDYIGMLEARVQGRVAAEMLVEKHDLPVKASTVRARFSEMNIDPAPTHKWIEDQFLGGKK